MTELYKAGECIDGAKVKIIAKKLIASSYTVSSTGFKGIKYKCSRDGVATIVKALDNNQIKEVLEMQRNVHLDVGDFIKCNSYFFIAQTSKRLNCFKITMMSGRHECHEGTPEVRVYAQIERPFESIANALEKRRNKLLEFVDGE